MARQRPFSQRLLVSEMFGLLKQPWLFQPGPVDPVQLVTDLRARDVHKRAVVLWAFCY